MEAGDQKVFIVSLDGATFDILIPFMRQGCMPNLQRLMQDSLSAELESVIPAVTAPAWTSFMTGNNPSKHGVFGFTQFDPADNRVKLTNARDIKSKTLWQVLSEKGKRSIVVNLPYTTPPYPINGILVNGWDSPPRNFTFPEDLTDKIMQQFRLQELVKLGLVDLFSLCIPRSENDGKKRHAQVCRERAFEAVISPR